MSNPISDPVFPPAHEARDYLVRQFEMAWALLDFHLNGLTTEELVWRPADAGLHVHPGADGKWLADWPEHEAYDLGPSSMAWLTWHLGFWWSMVLDHSAGKGTLSREEVLWPGSADSVRTWIAGFRAQWQALLGGLTDQDLRSAQRTRWPFQDRPFGDVLAWANVELTKSAAEIGYARFLYARRSR
jgi:hypothetical protein